MRFKILFKNFYQFLINLDDDESVELLRDEPTQNAESEEEDDGKKKI